MSDDWAEMRQNYSRAQREKTASSVDSVQWEGGGRGVTGSKKTNEEPILAEEKRVVRTIGEAPGGWFGNRHEIRKAEETRKLAGYL